MQELTVYDEVRGEKVEALRSAYDEFVHQLEQLRREFYAAEEAAAPRGAKQLPRDHATKKKTRRQMAKASKRANRGRK